MIAVGTRLGPYEIVSQLGAGGMGVVYKAEDNRLAKVRLMIASNVWVVLLKAEGD